MAKYVYLLIYASKWSGIGCVKIKKMIQRYIKREVTIILTVVPANVDIETTEALKLAEEVDPKGERTLGQYNYTVNLLLQTRKSSLFWSATL